MSFKIVQVISFILFTSWFRTKQSFAFKHFQKLHSLIKTAFFSESLGEIKSSTCASHNFMFTRVLKFLPCSLLPIIFAVCNILLTLSHTGVNKHFPLSVESFLNLRSRNLNYSLRLTQYISYKWLPFAYICAEMSEFYPNCAHKCCHDSASKLLHSSKYLFHISLKY